MTHQPSTEFVELRGRVEAAFGRRNPDIAKAMSYEELLTLLQQCAMHIALIPSPESKRWAAFRREIEEKIHG